MSNNEQNSNRNVIIPYVGIYRIIEFLELFHKHHFTERKLEELASLLGCGISNLNNIAPSIGILNLGKTKKGTVILNDDGLSFAKAIADRDFEKAKQIIKKNIPKSEALIFTKSLLETRTAISSEEIGRALSQKFNKKWKDLRTLKNVGNSCASIISYSGFGYFYNNILSMKSPTIRATTELLGPSVGYQPLLDVLKGLHGFERAKSTEIAKNVQKSDTVTSEAIAIGVVLGLVAKEGGNTYSLTDEGQFLIDPLSSDDDKTKTFAKLLSGSNYAEIIQKLANSKKILSFEEMGNNLSFLFKRNWSDSTKLSMAKKFTTWLNAAKLTEKVRPGQYKIIPLPSQIEQGQKTLEQDIVKYDLSKIYEIGRAIGNLESIILESDKIPLFKERIIFLQNLLEEHEDLRLALEMLERNYDESIGANNAKLCKPNIDFIREKIKEKLGIGERKQ